MTVAGAAEYLSQALSEPVNEVDLLQAALDGHLKLSVYFPNRATALVGHVLSYKDIPKINIPSLDGKSMVTIIDSDNLSLHAQANRFVEDTPFVLFGKEHVSIDGVWDLTMLGNEKIDIEFDVQEIIGGPEVTMINLNGTFLNRHDGTWASLQERSPDRIVTDGDGQEKKIKGSFYPAGRLGENCTRVIRVREVVEFQLRLEGKSDEKPVGTRERNTLLCIIAALCQEAKIDRTKPAKAAGEILNIMSSMGLQVGETTIEGHLKAIPGALESRTR